MADLGFVGLGAMGGDMVKRLLDAGHAVTGFNRTKSRAQWLLELGMQWGETPRDSPSRGSYHDHGEGHRGPSGSGPRF